MLTLGHRGAMALQPENTLLAITTALTDPMVAGVEFDVRLSADGVPMVFHDARLKRLTGQPEDLPFDLQTSTTLAGLRVRGEAIPTLAAVVDYWRALRPNPAPHSFNVELKPSTNFEALVAACRPILDPLSGDPDKTAMVVSSFDPRVLAAAERAGVPWRLALLYDKPEGLTALQHLAGGASMDLHPHHSMLTAAVVSDMAAPGRAFRCWTVNEPADARRIASLGCAAVICNDPSAMAKALQA